MNHDNTRTTPLTLESLQAARAARTPQQQEHDLAFAVAADLGLRSQRVADDYLAHGDLANARHAYQVAGHYDTPGAADALADVETLLEVIATTATNELHDGTGPRTEDSAGIDVERITVLDQLAAAAALVRRARTLAEEHTSQAVNAARTIIDNAREQADRLVAFARQEADRIMARAVTETEDAQRIARDALNTPTSSPSDVISHWKRAFTHVVDGRGDILDPDNVGERTGSEGVHLLPQGRSYFIVWARPCTDTDIVPILSAGRGDAMSTLDSILTHYKCSTPPVRPLGSVIGESLWTPTGLAARLLPDISLDRRARETIHAGSIAGPALLRLCHTEGDTETELLPSCPDGG